MPFMIAPIACSRMPKCSVRPYGPPGHILVWCSAGMKLGSPSIVVLLLSARSAEPPHSSGSTSASAVSILPDAARVETEFGLPSFSAGKLGSASVQPSGSVRVAIRSSSAAARSGFAAAQASNSVCHSACAAAAAVDDLAGVREHVVVDVEVDVRVEAEDLLGLADLVLAEAPTRAPCRCSAWSAPASR